MDDEIKGLSAPEHSYQISNSKATLSNPAEPNINAELPKGVSRSEIILVIFAMLIAALLMLYRIDDPLGGFHGCNEGFYSNLAHDYIKQPLFKIIAKPLDFNNPPLYPLMLAASFKIFGINEVAGRMISVTFTLLSIFFTYRIGTLLYSRRTGIIAAFMLAVSPAFLLVGRNIQTDPALVFFGLGTLFFYIRSLESKHTFDSILAGAFLGFGFLTKAPVILIPVSIIVWQAITARSLSWVNKKLLIFIGCALTISIPWYLFQIIANSHAFFQSQGYLASILRIPSLNFIMQFYVAELYWGLSPFVFLLFIATIIFLIRRHSTYDILILVIIAVVSLFYFFYNYHTYYLIPIFPIIIIGCSTFLGQIISKIKVLTITIMATVLISMLFAMAMLVTHKYAFFTEQQIAQILNESRADPIVLECKGLFINEPIIKYYCSKLEFREDNPKQFPTNKQVFFLLKVKAISSQYAALNGVYVVNVYRLAPVVFGNRIFTNNALALNANYFRMNPVGKPLFGFSWLGLNPAQTSSEFGLELDETPRLILIDWTTLGTPTTSDVSL